MRRIIATLIALVLSTPALADNYTATQGTGTTFAAKNIGGVLYPWWIPANSSGTELFTSGNAGYVQFPSAQAITCSACSTSSNQSTEITALGTINTTLGTPMQASGGTVTATQGTATNLKSQVSVASGGVALGAVATGAYASGAFASGAAASGSWADGSIVTLGTEADAACASLR